MNDEAPVQPEPLPEFAAGGKRPGVLSDSFLLGGRRALASGAFGTGLETLWLDGRHVLESLDVAGTRVESAIETPIGIERVLRAEGVHLSERIFVPSDAPLCVIEWRVLAANGSVAISFRSPRARLAPGAPKRVLLDEIAEAVVFAPPAVELEIGSPEPGGVRVTARLAVSPADVIRLVVSMVAGQGATPAVLVRARLGSLARAAAEQMLVRSPDERFNADFHWARSQLPALAATDAAASAATALLACGDASAARHLLLNPQTVFREGDDASAAPSSNLGIGAQYLAWTGDGSLALSRAAGSATPAPTQPGSLPPATERAEATVALVNHVVEKVLGIQPDATRHRLTLRPHLPAAWDFLEVERIRMGDALVRFRYQRDGDEHVVRVEQPAGAVPVRLILELSLPADGVAGASVDGQPAILDARLDRDRLRVPVQLVLDAPRELRVITRGGYDAKKIRPVRADS